MNSVFEGKKILFIAPKFFNYDVIIKQKLESLGAEVYLFDDRPFNSAFIKGLIRINRKLLSFYINKYYNNILYKSKSVIYDYVFFLKGESITENIIAKFRDKYSEAKFILYLWDSVKNNNNSGIYKYFDKILTFDKGDALKFEEFVFRPLFYFDIYKKIAQAEKQDFLYKFLFIGTAHVDRITILKRIVQQVKGESNSFRIVLYMPSKILFWYRKLFDRNFRGVKISEIEFTPVGHDELVELMKQSSIVIDIQHPKQTGLTMRTLEVLGAKKKMITTNAEIEKYDFFNTDNICVVDRYNPFVPQDFLESDYHEIPFNIYDKYSLESWLVDCFIGL
ncbi:hypothetical protein ACE01N_05015 [Saccharicrinis sp. FJH2]|uniref:hypothetical protein n=1 Tax=Saccharicrinis sp. FJH65 TaxID=3344659 RepID=UPI0035F3ADFB